MDEFINAETAFKQTIGSQGTDAKLWQLLFFKNAIVTNQKLGIFYVISDVPDIGMFQETYTFFQERGYYFELLDAVHPSRILIMWDKHQIYSKKVN